MPEGSLSIAVVEVEENTPELSFWYRVKKFIQTTNLQKRGVSMHKQPVSGRGRSEACCCACSVCRGP